MMVGYVVMVFVFITGIGWIPKKKPADTMNKNRKRNAQTKNRKNNIKNRKYPLDFFAIRAIIQKLSDSEKNMGV